jgi:SAM-dependent methyltransferase
MGFYVDRILPRITDVALGRPELEEVRAKACEGLAGAVLEVGFGSGRNVRHYSAEITQVFAVGPATAERDLAERRLARSSVPVDFVGLDGERLPLGDKSVDHVLTTWTLCTIPDVARALHEMRRVLRPGGTFHFVEHGLAPDPKVARWQRRLNPVQKKLFGGCHLDRPIDDLVAAAGLQLVEVDRYYATGPKPFSYFYAGTATRRPTD